MRAICRTQSTATSFPLALFSGWVKAFSDFDLGGTLYFPYLEGIRHFIERAEKNLIQVRSPLS